MKEKRQCWSKEKKLDILRWSNTCRVVGYRGNRKTTLAAHTHYIQWKMKLNLKKEKKTYGELAASVVGRVDLAGNKTLVILFLSSLVWGLGRLSWHCGRQTVLNRNCANVTRWFQTLLNTHSAERERNSQQGSEQQQKCLPCWDKTKFL